MIKDSGRGLELNAPWYAHTHLNMHIHIPGACYAKVSGAFLSRQATENREHQFLIFACQMSRCLLQKTSQGWFGFTSSFALRLLPNEDPPIGKRHWDLIKAALIRRVSQLTFFPFTGTGFRYREPASKRSQSHLASLAFITPLDE